MKLAGSVSPDPRTGRLTVRFDENPQLPFSSLRMSFPGGPRASLMNPPSCGTCAASAAMLPWSAADPANPTAETVTSTSAILVTVYLRMEGQNGKTHDFKPQLKVSCGKK